MAKNYDSSSDKNIVRSGCSIPFIPEWEKRQKAAEARNAGPGVSVSGPIPSTLASAPAPAVAP